MKLPNAPLVEVVFEMRWALQGPENVSVHLRSDPVYSLLASEFAENAKTHGFQVQKQTDSSPLGPLGHSVDKRFYRDEDSPFPVWQIGPGIFACNESTEYEWDGFKHNIENGLTTLLKSYPKSKIYPIEPVHLELRYIDSFGEDLLGHSDFVKFLRNDVNIKLNVNDFLKSNVLEDQFDGNIEIMKKVKGDEDTQFGVQISTAIVKGVRTIRLVNKVFKSSERLNLGKTNAKIIKSALEWADAAHGLTHAFFDDFVPAKLMDKFRQD